MRGGRRERKREGWKYSSGGQEGAVTRLALAVSSSQHLLPPLKEAAEGPVILSITITL